MRRPVLASLASLAVASPLSGCGTVGATPDQADDGVATSAPSSSAALSWQAPDGDVLVSCGDGPAFPASLAAEGGIALDADDADAIVTALANLKETGGIDAPGPLQDANADEVEWAVLWWDSSSGHESLGLLLAPAGSNGFSLQTDEAVMLDRQDGFWRAAGWSGTCGAKPVLPAQSAWAQVALPPESTAPAGTTVDLLVSEIDCTSARDPRPFLADPTIVETNETVTVYWTTEQVTGAADCPSNPWVAATIQLQDPLGSRTLLDGSTWPPTPVTVFDQDG